MLHSAQTTLTRHPWRPSPARLFAFAGGSLVVFLIAPYAWPIPVRGYVASARIDSFLASAGSENSSVPTIEQQNMVCDEVRSEQSLRTALQRVGPPANVPRTSIKEFPSQREIDFVRRHLTAIAEPTPDRNVARLAIALTGPDSSWTVSLLDAIVAQAAKEINGRAAQRETSNSSAESDRLAEATREEQAAQRALDGFLSRYFHALENAPDRNSSQSSSPVPQINPLWQSLHEQLQAQSAELDRILLDRTLEHPQAKEASLKKELLKKQLEATPRYISNESHSAQFKPQIGPRVAEAIRPVQFSQDSSPTATQSPQELLTGAGQTYKRLYAVWRQSRERREEIQVALNSVPAGTSSPVVHVKIVANAHLAQTLREPSSTSRLLLLTLASVCAGACFAAMIRPPFITPVFTTPAQVETDLSLPIVGVISLSQREREQER